MRFRAGVGVVCFIAVALFIVVAPFANAQTGPVRVTTPNVINVPGATQVTIGGQTFVNSGIFGMGRIAAGTRDFNNDSLGAFSGMDILLSSWRKTANGYTGTLFGLRETLQHQKEQNTRLETMRKNWTGAACLD